MYLLNISKDPVFLPTGETIQPDCISSYISSEDNTLPGMQKLYSSGKLQLIAKPSTTGTNRSNIKMCFYGYVYASYDFPDRLSARNGLVIRVGEDVSDVNPEKTNTGQSFTKDQYVMWYNGVWKPISFCE